MSRFKSPFETPQMVPWLGVHGRIVKPGEVVEVPDKWDDNFAEAGWVPVAPILGAQKDGD